MEWGRVQINPEIEDEHEGKVVNLGVEGSNSNGHRKEKDKEEHIMKILEGLQREAKACRDDSRNLMKVRDRQGALNLKFLKSLERIEKKLEKGRDSNTTGSHRTHGRGIRSRSGSRHLSRSQRHSDSKTHSSSSPSPTRKH
jgi:aminoglycoside N3'-acetyltransferase